MGFITYGTFIDYIKSAMETFLSKKGGVVTGALTTQDVNVEGTLKIPNTENILVGEEKVTKAYAADEFKLLSYMQNKGYDVFRDLKLEIEGDSFGIEVYRLEGLVDWGDGTIEELPGMKPDSYCTYVEHVYDKYGSYTVSFYLTNGNFNIDSGYADSAFEEHSGKIRKVEILSEGNFKLEARMFRYMPNLTEVYISDNSLKEPIIEGHSFANCSILERITLPKDVKEIKRYAFCEDKSLSSISLPEAVEKIGEGAFWKCPALIEVHLLSEIPPELEDYSVFEGSNNCIFYVKKGSVEVYKTAPVWSTLASRIREEG